MKPYLQIAATRRARLDSLVAQMHADYLTGMSMAAVSRKYGRCRGCVRELFERRGLMVRPSIKMGARLANGQIAPAKRHSKREVALIIKGAAKLRVPLEIKLEWRKWPLEQRGEFIARLRAKLQSPHDRPTSAFSSNVEPFDYATPKAQKLAAKLNEGTNSRDARIKIDICSQGVIWNGLLWFWSRKAGYVRMGPWMPQDGRSGRPLLHHVIWEEHHGREVPKSHVLIFADGNANNLRASNLHLRHRNDLARQNQAAALFRKSRELTAALLHRTQKRKEEHHAPDLIEVLQQAA